jgi:hypothetical protein
LKASTPNVAPRFRNMFDRLRAVGELAQSRLARDATLSCSLTLTLSLDEGEGTGAKGDGEASQRLGYFPPASFAASAACAARGQLLA